MAQLERSLRVAVSVLMMQFPDPGLGFADREIGTRTTRRVSRR